METQYRQILIVDDEPAARRKLRGMLERLALCDDIAEAGDGEQAVALIRRLQPELVFLDIQMPVMTGLQVALATRDESYQLIFVTAFDDYAIQAFETHAVDYLLKPVSQERLKRALAKVSELNRRLPATYLQQLEAKIYHQGASEQVAVRRGDATVIINSEHIGYIEAVSGYCRIVLTAAGQQIHGTDTVITDVPLEQMHQQLSDDEFLRLHRSFVVNSRQILAYFTRLRRMFVTLREFPGVEVPVSRPNAKLIKSRWEGR